MGARYGHILSSFLRLVPATGIFPLPFCDWFPLRVYDQSRYFLQRCLSAGITWTGCQVVYARPIGCQVVYARPIASLIKHAKWVSPLALLLATAWPPDAPELRLGGARPDIRRASAEVHPQNAAECGRHSYLLRPLTTPLTSQGARVHVV
eukprot:3571479-Pyramimonas_sp.AAC.1